MVNRRKQIIRCQYKINYCIQESESMFFILQLNIIFCFFEKDSIWKKMNNKLYVSYM